jgi:hypothetical protein
MNSACLSREPRYKLNAVCPYYTMFPLEFPYKILQKKPKNTVVFDPFCGRGTTNYAAQCLGLKSYGFDSSPIAVAIAKAKLASTTYDEVTGLARNLLLTIKPSDIPTGEFWDWAFHPDTLVNLCKLREGLLQHDDTDAAIMLRAIILGCMHGPLTKNVNNPSYFSNQMPRTFSSKPTYSVKYWQSRNMTPQYVDVITPILKKASAVLNKVNGIASDPSNILCTDSGSLSSFENVQEAIDLVISSPPYYGMRTYVQDHWLRYWFLGGPSYVDYSSSSQIKHISPARFASELAQIWDNIYRNSSPGIRMVIRFGGLSSKKAQYDKIFRDSINASNAPWEIYHSKNAGSATKGKRQADGMGKKAKSDPIEERDYFIRLSKIC